MTDAADHSQAPALPPETTEAAVADSASMGDAATANLLGLVILHELAELCVRRGVDPDMSGVFDRALGRIGAYEQISHGLAANGAAYDPSGAAARTRLRAMLRQHEPLLARLAEAKPDAVRQ